MNGPLRKPEKGCPFCKATETTFIEEPFGSQKRWSVRCIVCGAQSGPSPSPEAARTNWDLREACPTGPDPLVDIVQIGYWLGGLANSFVWDKNEAVVKVKPDEIRTMWARLERAIKALRGAR